MELSYRGQATETASIVALAGSLSLSFVRSVSRFDDGDEINDNILLRQHKPTDAPPPPPPQTTQIKKRNEGSRLRRVPAVSRRDVAGRAAVGRARLARPPAGTTNPYRFNSIRVL